jgi:hypothetical protein
MNKQNATHYHIVLDKSGSMQSHYKETLEGLNEKLLSIKAIQDRNTDQPIYVSLTLFSDTPELVFENLPAAQLPVLTEKDYVLDGMTGLLDAIGTVINRMKYVIGRDLKEQNGTVMIVIFTDGGENASRMFKFNEISSTIKNLEASGNWNFAFIGADIDAWGAASQLNMQQSRVYSSAKADIKETMHYSASTLEEALIQKREGKIWKGFNK